MPSWKRSGFTVGCSLLLIALVCCGGGGGLAGGGGSGGGGNPPPPNPNPPPSPGAGDPVVALPATVTTAQTWEAWRTVATGPYFPFNGGASRVLPAAILSSILDDVANDLRVTGVRFETHHAQLIEITNDNANPGPTPNGGSINWAAFDFERPFDIAPGETFDLGLRLTQVVLPLRQRVQAQGDRFYIYVDPIYGNSTFPAHWHTPAEYAEYAEALVRWMRGESPTFGPPEVTAARVVPDYWVILNEPNGGAFPMSEIGPLAVATRARFQSMGVPTLIQTTETTFPDGTGLQTVLSTPNITPALGLISFHAYDYTTSVPAMNSRNAVRSRAQAAGVRTAMTEICCRPGWNGSYTQALGWARDIYWSMTEADVSVWEPYTMAFTCSTAGCTGGEQSVIAIDRDHSRTFKQANYYGFRQYSRYIRPGYVRVNATCTNCGNDATVGQVIKPVVFRTPGGKYVAVVVNDSAAARTIYFGGFPAGTYDISGVDPGNATSPVTFTAQTISAGQYVSLNFPAQAIVTFVQR